MINKTLIIKYAVPAVAIVLLASSPLCSAAVYDMQDSQKNILEPLNNEPERFPSFLESLNNAEKNKTRENFQEVLSLIKQNKPEEAQGKVSSLLKEYPNEPEYYNLQALLDTLKKDSIAANKNYEKAMTLDPKNILARVGAAQLALSDGQLDKAKEYANQSLAINEKAVKAYLILAEVAYRLKNTAEAEKVLLTAQEKLKGNLDAEIEVVQGLAKLYAVQKQPEKFLSVSEGLSKRYPNDSKALFILAGAQAANNKKPAAEETLRQITNQDKQNIASRLLLANLLSEHSDKEKEVLKLLDEAAQISPDKPEVLASKAAYLIKIKRSQDALELAAKIDNKFPKLVAGKLLKGDAYLAERKLDKAADMYQEAYKLQPNNKVLLVLADVLSAQGKRTDAIKLLDDALEKDAKNAAIHFKLATVYQQQNDSKQAETHYKAILDQQPDNPLALNNLALIYSQQNNPQAIELAKKAYEKAPESAAILDTYGFILIKQGQPEEGLTYLEKAASLAPKIYDIQFHLAEAYVANDNKKKAIEILEPIVNGKMNFSEKQAAVNLLEKLKSH